MFKRQALLPAVFLLFCVFLFSCQKEKSVSQDGTNTLSPANSHQIHDPATVTQLSSGFNNPRELKFGPDGNLYVAEAGVGGTTSSASFNCAQQAPFPFGPYHGSPTGGRISRVNANGNRTTVTDDLPTALAGIGDVFGAADVAFIGNQLYVL
ncbi:MAG: ScyD/ScyE family protein, partial [Flavisolibacter sp.]